MTSAAPLQLLASIIETAPDAMLLVSTNGVIQAANARACHLFGHPDLVSRSIEDLLPDRLAEAHRAHRSGFLDDPRPRVMGEGRELLARRSDGSEFPVDVSLGLTETDDDRLISVAVRDVTQRQAEHARTAAFEFLVAATREAIFATDPDGLVTSWNAAAERLTGVPAADAIGGSLVGHLHLSDPAQCRDLLDQALAGEVVDGRRAHVVGNRRATPVSISVAPMAFPGGSALGVSGLVRDISEEIEMQEVLAEVQIRMNQTQRLARIGLWAWDLLTDEVQWSEQLYALAGTSPSDFAGDLASHLAIIADEYRDEVEAAMRAAASDGADFTVEFEICRPNGERRWVHQTGDAVFRTDHRAAELRGICQDVTDRRRAFEALREADQLKDEFLGTVSHELRTPLTSILGFAELMADDLEGDHRQFMDIIVRNGQEMHDMVERILDFTRVRSGKLELVLEPQRVDLLVEEAWPLVLSLVADHTVEIEIDDDAVATTDTSAFTRILVNLVSNATKFSPPGSRIAIRARRAGTWCRMDVSDEGPGIPEGEIESVFERFHQVRSTLVSEKRGAGVGLAIVRSYCELMGGRVWAESGDSGTTMIVELPA